MMKTTFRNFGVCQIHFARYINGRTAIRLTGAEGFPIATATVNAPNVPLQKDEVIIKDYSENEGIFMGLIQDNVIEDTGRRVPLGYAEGRIAKLTEEALKWISKKEIE